LRSVSLLALIVITFGLGACDTQQDTLAAKKGFPAFDMHACVPDIRAGVQFPPDGCLVSPNGAYVLVMRHSGALDIVAAGDVAAGAKPIWTTGSRGVKPDSALATFQEDGNLVVYDQPGPRPIWNSMSNGPLGTYRLELSDAGEAKILDAAGKIIWSSKTDSPGKT
jgi:hypothetical protein